MNRNYWTLNKEGMKNRLSKAQAAYENALENVENLHVKISDGNSKLGELSHLYRLSLSWTAGTALSAPRAAMTCATT